MFLSAARFEVIWYVQEFLLASDGGYKILRLKVLLATTPTLSEGDKHVNFLLF